jgi:hypothetical protein
MFVAINQVTILETVYELAFLTNPFCFGSCVAFFLLIFEINQPKSAWFDYLFTYWSIREGN